jgi:hypothetical protein
MRSVKVIVRLDVCQDKCTELGHSTAEMRETAELVAARSLRKRVIYRFT